MNANENIMMEYICQEPDYIQEIFENKDLYTKAFVKLFLEKPIKRVYFSGSGSPHIIGRIMSLFFKKVLKVETSCEPPAILNNHKGFNCGGIFSPEEMLLICPAQTGRTTGPLNSARLAKQNGITTLCLTLTPNGPQAQESDIVILKPTGSEESFPESKGFAASLAILMLCALDAAYALGRMDEKTYQEYMEAFSRLPQCCRNAISAANAWFDRNEKLITEADGFRFVGYGIGYYVAQEAMLKTVESVRKPCMPFETEEYVHGNVMELKKDSVAFFLSAESGREKDRLLEVLTWCRQHSEKCVLIGSTETPGTDELSLTWDMLDFPDLNAIELLIPFQIIAHRGALATGNSTLTAPYPHAIREMNGFYNI